jgi:hypothetical protein
MKNSRKTGILKKKRATQPAFSADLTLHFEYTTSRMRMQEKFLEEVGSSESKEFLRNSGFIFKKRGLVQARATAEGLDFLLQSLNHFLILPNGLLELKMSIEVTHVTDDKPQENGAEDDQKKRNLGHFPLMIPERIKTKAENNLILVLHQEYDHHENNNRPKEYFYPTHFSSTPFFDLFFAKMSINVG